MLLCILWKPMMKVQREQRKEKEPILEEGENRRRMQWQQNALFHSPCSVSIKLLCIAYMPRPYFRMETLQKPILCYQKQWCYYTIQKMLIRAPQLTWCIIKPFYYTYKEQQHCLETGIWQVKFLQIITGFIRLR